MTNENWQDYAQRLCSNKQALSLTWQGIASLINAFYGFSYSEKYYRSHFNAGDWDEGTSPVLVNAEESE